MFYIGGTKCGALFGEALIITEPRLQYRFKAYMKQHGAVLAKGWLLGVQFEALLQDGLYFEMARHANAMAARLQTGLKALGWTLMVDSPTNQIFPVIPNTRKSALDQLCAYEDWCPGPTPDTTVIRFVTCFATTAEVARLLSTQRNFLEDHLASWAPLMTADLRRFAQCGLYQGLASLTDGFLQVEEEFFDEIFETEGE